MTDVTSLSNAALLLKLALDLETWGKYWAAGEILPMFGHAAPIPPPTLQPEILALKTEVFKRLMGGTNG